MTFMAIRNKAKTVKGCLTFEVPPNVTVDSYIYGNLTWVL